MKRQQEDLREYYTWGFPVLTLMAIIAGLGIVATVVLQFFF